MKIRFHHILPIVILIIACNKDKFTTEPQVTVKSISPGTVSTGNIISLTGNFTDDEGDIDSALVIYKWYDGEIPTLADTLRYSIAGLGLPPKTRKGDITVQFEYNSNNTGGVYLPIGGAPTDTTATIGLLLIDAANHRSNYSESAKVRLLK